ncbi:MAG: TlpA family protein disulfide reductase [Bacteroidetes bacterium]|nr:TlpA family protein disulfide reductase [Bacteroidota bacterium]
MLLRIQLIWVVFLLSFTLAENRVSVVNMEQLKNQTIKKDNDSLYVINFWATWCKPCIQELPYFQSAAEKFSGKKVKFLFVSLNSLKELKIVETFTINKKIKQEVLLLNAGNPNVWIDKVDSTWSGSIPATVMYKNGQKMFFKEGEFTQTEIDSITQLKTNTP